MPPTASESLADRVRRLRREVADHKHALNYHRRALAGAKAELNELEATCHANGIRIVVNPQSGEGDIHGPHQHPRS